MLTILGNYHNFELQTGSFKTETFHQTVYTDFFIFINLFDLVLVNYFFVFLVC